MFLDGSDLMVFADGRSIGGAKSSTLNISANAIGNASKDCDGAWDSSIIQSLAWEMGTDNLFADNKAGATFDDLFKAMIKREPISVIFSLGKNSKDKDVEEVPEGGWTPPTAGYYSGKALITDLKATAGASEKATYSATFKGTGKLSPIDAEE